MTAAIIARLVYDLTERLHDCVARIHLTTHIVDRGISPLQIERSESLGSLHRRVAQYLQNHFPFPKAAEGMRNGIEVLRAQPWHAFSMLGQCCPYGSDL